MAEKAPLKEYAVPKQKSENKLTDEEQKDRFLKAAKRTEVDKEVAEKAFKKISTSCSENRRSQK